MSANGANVNYDGDGMRNEVFVTDAVTGVDEITVSIAETGISESPNVAACSDNGDVVVCTVTLDGRIFANLGSGNDLLVSTAGAVEVARFGGEGGDDDITGSDAVVDAQGSVTGDDLSGDEGTDILRGGNGEDELDPGEGDGDQALAGLGDDEIEVDADMGAGDLLDGGDGVDDLQPFDPPEGEPGYDVNLATGVFTRVGGGPAHTLRGIENVSGSDAADTFTGGPGSDLLTGSDGNDIIDGGLGADTIDGEVGADLLRSRDGVHDRVLGGVGADTCELDQLDEHESCESALVATVPIFGLPVADQAGPSCTTPGHARRARRRRVVSRGVVLRLRCNEPGRAEARLVGRLRSLRRGSRIAGAGDITLGQVRKSVSPNRSSRLRLRVSRQFRRSLARRARLRIVVETTDALGNRSTLTRRVRLR